MARDGKKSSSEPDGKEKKKKRHEDESEDELDRIPKKSRKKHETSSEDDEEGGGKSEKLSSRSKRKEKEKGKKKMKNRSRKRYSDDDDEEDYSSSSIEYSESETESGLERSEYTETDSEEERRRRKRKRKRKRREREYEKEKQRRRKEKERRRRKKEKEKEAKERKKKKEGKITAVTNKWGKYGIIRETDMWNKRPEFTAWLAEVKQVNLESLPNWEEKQMFKEFMEDHNTATFPSKKYYNLDAYHRHKLEKQVKKGMKKVNETERTVFDDEGQRRQELKIAREKQKEETVEVLKRSMQSGMAQAMKEQAQLREEMAYQYKLGNFEAAAAIQRRLDPDVAM